MIFLLCQYFFLVLLLGLVGLSYGQRYYGEKASGKRWSTIYTFLLITAPTVAVISVVKGTLEPHFFYLTLGAVFLCFIVYRKKIFRYTLKCRECGKGLSLSKILFSDSNCCEECESPQIQKVSDIDWENHSFTEEAVLCFIRHDGNLLLIHKKTGLGKGKINAPGGRIEEGESSQEAAIRECQEEVGLTPKSIRFAGQLNFYFQDGYSLKGTVYTATDFEGTLTETDEANPFWCPEELIPYDQMWEDDRYWLPKLLKGESFEGYFLLKGEKLLDYQLK